MAHSHVKDPEAMTSQMVAASTDPIAPSVAVALAVAGAGADDLTFGTNVSPGGARSNAGPALNRQVSADPVDPTLPRDFAAGDEATAPPLPNAVSLTTLESAPTQGTRDERSAAIQAPPPTSPRPGLANLFSEDVRMAGDEEPPQRSILPRPSPAVNLQEAMDSDVFSEATHPPASPTPPQDGSLAAEQLPVISIEDEDLSPPQMDEELACLEVTKGWGSAVSASSKELAAQVMKEEDKSVRTEEAEAASVLTQMGQGQKKMGEQKSRNKKGLRLVIAEEPSGIPNPAPVTKSEGNGEPATSWADEPLDQYLPRPEAKETNLSSASMTVLPPTPVTTITTVNPPAPAPTPEQTTTTAHSLKATSMTTPTKPTVRMQTVKLSAAQIEVLEAAQKKREAKAGIVTTPENTTKPPPPARPTKPKVIHPRILTRPTTKPLMVSSPTAKVTSRSSSCGTVASLTAVSREDWDRELDKEIRRVETRRAKRLGGWHMTRGPFIDADFNTTDDEDDEITAFIPEDGIVKCLADDPPNQGAGRVKNIKTSGKSLASPSKPGKGKGKVSGPLKVKLFDTVNTVREKNERENETQIEAKHTGKSVPTPKSSGVAKKRARQLVDDFEDVWPHAGKIAVGRRSIHLRRHWTKVPPPGIRHGWAAHQEFFSFVTAGIVAERLFVRNPKKDEEAREVLETAYNGLKASSGKRMMELAYGGPDLIKPRNKAHFEIMDQEDQVAAAVRSAFILRKTLHQLLNGETFSTLV